MEKRKTAFEIVWFFFKPYKLQVTILLILSLLAGILEAALVAAVYPILTAAFVPEAGQSNLILSVFGSVAKLLPIKDEFIAYCVFFVAIVLVDFAVKILFLRFRIKFSASLVETNQRAIFEKFMRADYQYFIDHKQGELIYNNTSAPSSISSVINTVTELTSQTIFAVMVFSLLFSLSWKGGLLVLLLGTGYYSYTRYLGKTISYRSGVGELHALKDGNVILNESIGGIKQVKVFATIENWITVFNRTIGDRWRYFTRRTMWEQIPPLLLTAVTYLFAGIMAVIIKLITADTFTQVIPLFGTFAFAVFRISPLVSNVGTLTMQIMGALPNCETVYSVLQEKTIHVEEGTKELLSFDSDVIFDNVFFAYKGRDKTLRGVSVSFKKGATTAIVGRSGAGKTTVVSLLLRLFDVDEGEIRIDGVNIKEYRLASWLKNIGYVSQDTFILNDTIENNVKFRSDRYSREDVIEAAKYADAHAFISELPKGYETVVGDKGMRLSGGQAQKIAVARAMIRKPEILIFDEATNNLDSISEAAVQKAIDEISKDHTVIIIAHRLSTIVNADKILVLGDGRLLDEGTHEELLKTSVVYRELFQGKKIQNG